MPVHCCFPVYSLIFLVRLPQENPSVHLNNLPAEKKKGSVFQISFCTLSMDHHELI